MRMQVIFMQRWSQRFSKKESQITALQEDIKTSGITKQEAEIFMSSITKLDLT